MPIENLRTDVGHIVWGNPKKAQVKKHQSGPMKGQPVLRDGKAVEQWAFGVAFPKPYFFAMLKPAFDQEAMSGFPHGVPQNFSWKYIDGDGVDKQGKPYSAREGYAGCIILTVSTEAFAPQVFKNVNGAYYEVSENEIKTGDYVALNLNLKLNVPTDRTHTPGLYVNPNGIELVAQGTAIINSANPEEMFGGATYQLPPGATPLGAAPQMQQQPPGYGQPAPQYQPQTQQQPAPQQAPYGQPAPQYQPQPQQPPMQPQQAPYGQPAPQYQPQPQQQPAPQYGQQPGMMPQPAHDFVQNAGMQQQPGYLAQQPPMQPQQAPYGQPAPQYQPQPQQQPAPQYGQQPGMMPQR